MMPEELGGDSLTSQFVEGNKGGFLFLIQDGGQKRSKVNKTLMVVDLTWRRVKSFEDLKSFSFAILWKNVKNLQI